MSAQRRRRKAAERAANVCRLGICGGCQLCTAGTPLDRLFGYDPRVSVDSRRIEGVRSISFKGRAG